MSVGRVAEAFSHPGQGFEARTKHAKRTRENIRTSREAALPEDQFNNSSSKVPMNIFDMLEDAAKKGDRIQVNCVYDPQDENILEFGEEFQEDFEHAEFMPTPKGD